MKYVYLKLENLKYHEEFHSIYTKRTLHDILREVLNYSWEAGMSPKRDFSLTSACVQPPPMLYTGYFTYPSGFINVTLFLNQHILESEIPILKDKGDCTARSWFRVLRIYLS